MNMTSASVDQIREAVADRHFAQLRTIEWDTVTLGAALELACCWWMWQDQDDQEALGLLKLWADRKPILSTTWRTLNGDWADVAHDDRLGALSYGIRPILHRSNLVEEPWILFEARFKRSLAGNGFGSKRASALSGAFHEMADNVVQHSTSNNGMAPRGLAGYQTAQGQMTYAVADVGRGVLQSLRENPRWTGLTSSKDALRAAVQQHATRRSNDDEGGGFRDVEKALADMGGFLRFRSGDGFLTIDGRAEEGREVRDGFVTPLVGFQLSVSCHL